MGGDLLSSCSPRIMGFTMPLSISSFPELCREKQEKPFRLKSLPTFQRGAAAGSLWAELSSGQVWSSYLLT